MQSSTFSERALSISVGSLSPTINWPTLEEQEFDLPPLDQQRDIAELLWGVESLRRRLVTMRAAMQRTIDRSLNAIVATASMTTLGAHLERIEAGRSPSAAGRPAESGELGVLKVSAVGDGVFRSDENKALLSIDDFDQSREVRPGDLLVSRANASISGVARPCVVDDVRDGLMLSDKTLRLIPKEGTSSQFLLLSMRTATFRRHVRLSANGTEAKNISQAKLRLGPVPDLAHVEQALLIDDLQPRTSAILAIERQLALVELLGAAVCREVGI